MDEKTGVFISHITEERTTALLLKDVLHQTFGNDVRVFVSSDYVSIPGGDVWFQAITEGLKTCAVIIVLLSPDSLDRRWINFEAGVGIGANAKVIPVVVHGLERSDVGHPITNLQIRSLQTAEEAGALLKDIGDKLGREVKTADPDALVTFASQRTVGSGWAGVDWAKQFLAVEGPVLKLRKVDDQQFVQEHADALKNGGFTPYKANRYHIGPSISAGYKAVYLTDKKTYYAEITDWDAILMAKPEKKS